MRKIKLTQGREALVDDFDYEYLNQWKWYFDGLYAGRASLFNGKQRHILMHRVIAERMNLDMSHEIDHVNQNKLDERRMNLRSASRSENVQNTKKRSDNTTGYKGVTCIAGRYIAQIMASGKKIHLGCYDAPEQAAAAYDHWAKIYFGERACINGVDTPFVDARGKNRHNTSGYRWVSWDKSSHKWAVNIRGKFIGYFTDKLEAVKTANLVALKIYGPNAYQNK